MRDEDDLTPTEHLDPALVRAARPENDDDVTKRECPRCNGRGAAFENVAGQQKFERGDCTLCGGEGWCTHDRALAWELHREMTAITKGPR